MKQIWYRTALIIGIQLIVFQLLAQVSPENLKTALVYRIANCVKWKADTASVFRVGVLSDNEVLVEKFKELSKVARLNKKPIQIKHIPTFNAITNQQMIYVDKSYNEVLPEIINHVGKNTLIITDEHDSQGDIMINLIYDSNKSIYTFVYNRANILFANLDLTDEIVLLKGSEIEIRGLYLEAKKYWDNQLEIVNELKKQSDLQQKIMLVKNDSILGMKKMIASNQSEISKQIHILRQKDSLSTDLNKKIENQQYQLELNLIQTRQLITNMENAEQLAGSYQEKINHQTILSDSLAQQISAKQRDLDTLNYSLDKKETLIKKQNSWLLASLIIILIVFISAILISRAYVVTRNARQKIADQKRELETIIDQLRSTQQQLIQSEKMASLGVFIAGIAHEINNPVNFISMGVDSMEKLIHKLILLFTELNKLSPESSSDEIVQLIELKNRLNLHRSVDAVPEVLANIKIGITRTISIANGLRLYTRMESEEKSNYDINRIIETALVLIKPQLNSEIVIDLNFGKLQEIKVYAGKLSQVFVNILSNAIDAIHNAEKRIEKHKITITTYQKDEIIHIEFSDTGTGIPADVLAKIFDPFYTTKEVGKGTGLGMSIATSIIGEHNGKIEAYNNSDRGATFNIEIPVNID